MNNLAKRKLLKNFKEMRNDKTIEGIIAAPVENNIMKWNAVIFGPKDTPFEDGVFELKMDFPDDYPLSPPKVSFVTPVYHPNVYKNGDICLDILQAKWSQAYDVSAILNSIQSLLNDPNPKSPANAESAKDFESNKPEYIRKVKECVENSIRCWKENHPDSK